MLINKHSLNFGLLLEKIKYDCLNYKIHWDHEIYTLLEKVIAHKGTKYSP